MELAWLALTPGSAIMQDRCHRNESRETRPTPPESNHLRNSDEAESRQRARRISDFARLPPQGCTPSRASRGRERLDTAGDGVYRPAPGASTLPRRMESTHIPKNPPSFGLSPRRLALCLACCLAA